MTQSSEAAISNSSGVSLDAVIEQANKVILGKERVIRLALTCLIARGHLLIEDLPGVGKTTLSHLLAKILGLSYQRIQFTSDLLPADILGVSIYNRDEATFNFHAGPVFSQLILADEINRATPRTQSALLEAMEEDQVTIEGETRSLPKPFFVIATQNPSHQIGTYPLPESQLDRFMMRIEIGYPNKKAERELFIGQDRREMINTMEAVLSPIQLMAYQKEAERIHVADALLQYLQDLMAFTRESGLFVHGLSPRAGLSFLQAARAWALLNGQDEVLPEDLQSVVPSVAGHRLQHVEDNTTNQQDCSRLLIENVPIP